MNEAEWLASTDSQGMLEFLDRGKRHPAGERKLRLYTCACCRRVWPLLEDERSRQAVEVAEQFSDGPTSQEELEATVTLRAAAVYGARTAFRAAVSAANDATGGEEGACPHPVDMAEMSLDELRWRLRESLNDIRRSQCELLREILGNPFRPLSINPSWLTPAVISLAQAAYNERMLPSGHLDPARLAVLADALEEAGCADQNILGHLRSQGAIHVLGCFVVDLLLGRG